MFKNKTDDGRHNISGKNIKRYRQELPQKTSQRALAYLLQLKGVDVDKNAIQRMESGQRFVTDIELRALASIFQVKVDDLLESK